MNPPVILCIGPVPPPYFGQAIGMQVLLDAAQLGECYKLVHVNTNNVGKGGMRRFLSTIWSLLEYTGKLIAHRPSVVYLMITRSRLGCIKDCLILMLAHVWRVPVVVHLRGGDLVTFCSCLGSFGRSMLRLAYRRVRFGIVLGESLRSQFGTLLPPERVRVVFNCWHDGDLDPSSCRAERVRDQPLRITFLSNVLPSKGLYDALEGIAWAIREGVRLQFCFAGEFLDHDGAIAKLPELAHENVPSQILEERYEQTISTLGIGQHVRKLGAVTGQRKWQLLEESDIVLLPIYNPTEGQPLVAIEAMRAGCALISTECGGLIDIVEDGMTGRVVPPRNPEEVGKAVKWFWDHPSELTRIANQNIIRAKQLHSPEQHIRRIREICDEVLSPRVIR